MPGCLGGCGSRERPTSINSKSYLRQHVLCGSWVYWKIMRRECLYCLLLIRVFDLACGEGPRTRDIGGVISTSRTEEETDVVAIWAEVGRHNLQLAESRFREHHDVEGRVQLEADEQLRHVCSAVPATAAMEAARIGTAKTSLLENRSCDVATACRLTTLDDTFHRL
jgi:hypothetical protein